ncbi:GtrA family protein [Pontibacter sp. HSC-14F20]|uniref:GtrA family protein n=1 Tax=Pontibacter sp. HSC-14F20 TaxID=2864136 RepID=UPI001C72DB7D|nr:GtrA family protein [Pontibacter sp. HSC-14F20]MBX0334275.1 GtrA family protein [Pontibacter sp. HSC-14F20]
MLTFLRAQAASLIASGVDFVMTILAVELVGLWYVTGTVMGTVSGGITHFSLGRTWVFKASDKTIPTQFLKYFMVWNGSLVLNASGVYMVTQYGGVNYIFSKVLVSLFVGFSYNYIIQKKYVFR